MRNFRCRLDRTVTRLSNLRVRVFLRVDLTRDFSVLRRGGYSTITHGVPVADRVGRGCLFARPVILSGRILVRQARTTGGKLGPVHGRLSLTNGALCVPGSSPTRLELRGLKRRVNSAVCIVRSRLCSKRRLTVVITGKSVSCTIYSRRATILSRGRLPRVSVGASVDFARLRS